jgi:hypothetical protein
MDPFRRITANRCVTLGTLDATSAGMAIILICWASISLVVCLAMCFVAARPQPSILKQVTFGCDAMPRREHSVPQSAQTASMYPGNAFATSCHAA